MPEESEAWQTITGLLEKLTDKQLSNLVLVIRELQMEREDEKILSLPEVR